MRLVLQVTAFLRMADVVITYCFNSIRLLNTRAVLTIRSYVSFLTPSSYKIRIRTLHSKAYQHNYKEPGFHIKVLMETICVEVSR